MADNKVSEAYVEIGAKMDKLDRDLKRTEQKVEDSFEKAGQKAGEAMELSIVNRLAGIFAALSTIETAFRGAEAITEAIGGNLEGALDAIERMPFGIGPAVAAARDFFQAITGSREEAERLAAEWANVAGEIRTAQSEVDKLIELQTNADLTPQDQSNLRTARINELNRQLQKLKKEVDQSGNALSESLQQRLADIGIEAENAGDAIDALTDAINANYEAGVRARAESFEDLTRSGEKFDRQAVRENLQALDIENADLELRRLDAYYAMKDALETASSEVERQRIINLHETRMTLIEREVQRREQAEEEAQRQAMERAEREYARRLELRNREIARAEQREQAEARRAERDRFVESKGFSAAEFLRTSFAGGQPGKPQEVKDKDVVDELIDVNGNLGELIRKVGQSVAAMV